MATATSWRPRFEAEAVSVYVTAVLLGSVIFERVFALGGYAAERNHGYFTGLLLLGLEAGTAAEG